MKFIFTKILTLLGQVDGLRWIDKDKGQLEMDPRPPVAFPCALFKIELPKCVDQGGRIQQCTARITLRLAFDYAGETSAVTPAPNLANSIAYYDIVDAVYALLQGFTDNEVNEMSREAFYEEVRGDGLTVGVIPFSTEFVDELAAI